MKFGKKTTVKETPVRNLTFAEKMANIKAVFKTAYDEKEERMYLVRKEHENEFN